MSNVELFIDMPEGDPWDLNGGTPTWTAHLNEDLIGTFLQGPAEGINDASAGLALLTLADDELRAFGTDGGQKLSDAQITLVLRALRAVCARVGIALEIPFRNFTGFRTYWNRMGASGTGGWQARRDLLGDLFNSAFEKIEELETYPQSTQLPEASLAKLRDPAAIQEQLRRIQRAILDDPALAVGSAKELIESTAKVVLIERGRSVDDKADLPALVKEAQQSLGLHPSSATPGPDGTDAVKKILGGVSAVAIGVAELRNRGYGTGHGPASTRIGLSARHAHLAVNASMTWCQLMLDTLADPKAPWQGP